MNALSFSYLIDLLSTLLNTMQDLVVGFSKTPNDILLELGIELQLPDWLLGDVTLISLMVGGSVVIYLGYQFFTWVLNIVT